VIRQSTATRLLGLGYTSVLAGVGITQLIDGSGSLVALILVAFAAVAGVRMWRFGVVADEASLVVRNTVRTRRLARSDIADFRLDDLRFTAGLGQAVRALGRDGRVQTLGVTRGLRGRPDRDRHLAELRRWLGSGRR